MNNMARIMQIKVQQDMAFNLVRLARTPEDRAIAEKAYITARDQMVYHAPVFKDLINGK